jgi:hypothetical protein
MAHVQSNYESGPSAFTHAQCLGPILTLTPFLPLAVKNILWEPKIVQTADNKREKTNDSNVAARQNEYIRKASRHGGCSG